MALTPVEQQVVTRVFAKCASQVWSEWSANTPTPAEIYAAVGAASAWQDGNQASFVAALPQPFRDASNGAQKVLLFISVACAQYLVDNPDAADFMACITGRLQGAV